MVEAVLSGFEGASLELAEEIEDIAAADDAGGLEAGGDGGGAEAGGDVYEGLVGGAEAVVADEVGSESGGEDDEDGGELEEGLHGFRL